MRVPCDTSPFRVCHRLPVRHFVAVAIVTVTAIVVSSVIAFDGGVTAWELWALKAINGWPDWFKPAMWFLQQPGVLFAPVVAGLTIFWFTRKWQHLIPFVLVLPLKLGIEKGLVKQLVQRERPFVSVGPEINVRGPAFEGLSFPSGHTTTAFATALLLTAFLPPRWRPVPVIWAAIVGIARMYYGEHNLLDVVAGASMGTLFATLLWVLFLNRLVDSDCTCE